MGIAEARRTDGLASCFAGISIRAQCSFYIIATELLDLRLDVRRMGTAEKS